MKGHCRAYFPYYKSCTKMNTACLLNLVAFLIISNLQLYLMCPSICSCKWKNGKQTAECAGKGLTIIPSDLDVGTQVIDISDNSFRDLISHAFRKKGLVNLQKIFISDCAIASIADEAFFQLSNLIELDLSRNQLQAIPTNALKDCSNLRRLQLGHNPITIVKAEAFSTVSHLSYLSLSNCKIKHIHIGALNGLKKLDVIELDGNQLTTLSIDIFQSLSNLFGLHLHNNPWHCDCKVREIRTWMLDNNIPISVSPHCESPVHLRKNSWKNLTLEDFACAPKMIQVPKEYSVISGHNASIHCLVHAVPRASIHWEVDGKALKNLSNYPEMKIKYHVETEELPSRQSSILTIYNASEGESDIYFCIGENKAGSSVMNFSLTVLCPSHLNSSWSSTQITLLLFGVLFLILLSVVVICLLVYHPVSLSLGSKINQKPVLHHLSSKKQDAVEMNDIRGDKEGKDIKATDKHPRHETGSSGYGSDQLTPDLVSKIADMNNGPSLSTSTVSCNHFDSSQLAEYGSLIDQWPHGKLKVSRYDGSSPVPHNGYSEIYLNPSYSKDNDVYNYALQSAGVSQLPDCTSGDRYILQNVRTLREDYQSIPEDSILDDSCSNPQDDGYKRYSMVVVDASGSYTLPSKSRFSPDEGYAEEGLEGTEV